MSFFQEVFSRSVTATDLVRHDTRVRPVRREAVNQCEREIKRGVRNLNRAMLHRRKDDPFNLALQGRLEGSFFKSAITARV